jgi:signal transduction histidine kinase
MPRSGWPSRPWPAPRGALTVLGGLTGFVAAVYGVVVVGGGALLGSPGSPSTVLSIAATAVVALAAEPVQARLERFAARRSAPGGVTPEEALRRFRAATDGPTPAGDLPVAIARTLAEATGATSVQVWLDVRGRPVRVAAWPPGPEPPAAARPEVLEIGSAGSRLGELRLHRPAGAGGPAVEERLVTALAGQAGLALRGAALQAELTARRAELQDRAAELQASRERLVAVQDEERRRLERDVHDGAQQHLVALAVNLRLATALARRDRERAAELLTRQVRAAEDAVGTLRALSRGIYPAVLTERGLPAALAAAAAPGPLPVQVRAEGAARYPAAVEAALYFAALEALQNAAKHSGARQVQVHVVADPAAVTVTVTDDGRGFDPAATARGAGLANMRDRLDAVGGELAVDSAPGAGVRVTATAPAGAPAPDGGA